MANNILNKLSQALLGNAVQEASQQNVQQAYPQQAQEFLKTLPQQDYMQRIYNTPIQERLSNDQINEAFMQGRNLGIPQLAQKQQELGIRIPKTGEEIDLAMTGDFNKYPALEITTSTPQRQGGVINDILSGYKENYNNKFNVNNLGQGNNAATMLGEGLGTLGRFADSSLGRGALTALAIKALGGDNSDMLNYGLQASVARQNAKLADDIYRQQLANQGIETSDYRGNITDDVYKNVSTNAYRYQRNKMQQDIADAKDKTSRVKMILDGYNKNIFTADDVKAMLEQYGYDINDLNISNATRSQNLKEKLEPAKLEVQKQKANTSATRVANSYALGKEKNAIAKEKIKSKQSEKPVIKLENNTNTKDSNKQTKTKTTQHKTNAF
ncbi:MAG: hypothetical protein MJ211_10050 [Bacteroidales bacterium]|nr:hypothetical protein [Bacteroidales bacterium]